MCQQLAYASEAETSAQVAGVLQAATPPSQQQPAVPAADATQEQRALLEKRVIAKWDALIKKDFAQAYTFTSPSYRKLYSLDDFKRKFGSKVVWRGVDVLSVSFEGDDAASVDMNIRIVYHDSQTEKSFNMKTHVKESWVRADGQWWYLMEE